jgi:cytoskeletal protein CcmA (bactofilin family)
MIGKSIVVKGEINSSDPIYIDGRVEGSIKAPSQRVTVGREGTVNADINAREVIIMGEVTGNLDGGHRVEVRSAGSLTGTLTTQRVCVEDGAVLNATIHVRESSKKDKIVEVKVDADSDEEPQEAPAA